MGIFDKSDEKFEEIDLDEELAKAEGDIPDDEQVVGFYQDYSDGSTTPITVPKTDDAPQQADEPGLVKIRVTAQHNGLRRGDLISVSAERAEHMVKSGVGEVA